MNISLINTKRLKDLINRGFLHIVQRDSIPYEVTKVKEIQRSLTLFDKLCRACFWFLTTCLTLFIAHKLKR